MISVVGLNKQGTVRHRIKRAAIGLTASVGITVMVTGCGLVPSGGQLGGSGGSSANGVPQYTASEFQENKTLTRSWLHSDAGRKTVALSVALSANELALNGYSHGFAEVDVPTGWQVTVNFINKNNVLPGGLMVAQPGAVVSSKHVSAAIPGATMKQPYQGIGLNQSASFRFLADKPGTYVLWSAPSGMSGTWMWFRVVKGISSPVVKVKKSVT